jgi:hypothetical protein
MALAASCAPRETHEILDRSDAAFVGQIVSHVGPEQKEMMTSADPVTYTFDVEAVVKGDVGRQVQVVTAANATSPGSPNASLQTESE